jgi:hypothetical protein
MWNLVSVHLDTVLVLVQDSSMVCAKRTIGSESFWTHLMVLLGDEAQVDARFIPFGDSAYLDARLVHGLRQTYQWLRNHFGRNRWYS